MSSIKTDIQLDTTRIIKIKGVTNDIIKSYGVIPLDFFFNDIIITHDFHVVPDDFNIPSDGIIGKDFNRRFKCMIDYDEMAFTIRNKGNNIKLKIFSECKNNVSALPARCESFRVFHIENFNGPSLIPSQEISPGILIPNTIAHAPDVVVRVLNTNTCMEKISNKISNTNPLSEFDIFTVNNEGDIGKNTQIRNDQLVKLFFKKHSITCTQRAIEFMFELF